MEMPKTKHTQIQPKTTASSTLLPAHPKEPHSKYGLSSKFFAQTLPGSLGLSSRHACGVVGSALLLLVPDQVVAENLPDPRSALRTDLLPGPALRELDDLAASRQLCESLMNRTSCRSIRHDALVQPLHHRA